MKMTQIFGHLRNRFTQFIQHRAAAAIGIEPDEKGRTRASTTWKPKASRHRVEIIVTGDPSRVGVVADAVDDLQKNFFGDAARPENLEVRITAFLDRCTHRSKWNKKPFKAATEARKWHCKQSPTKFANAFAESAGEMIDTLVIVGHRFDDDMDEALRQAAVLKEQGVHIHCFHTGADETSKAAYEKLAEQTDGVFLQLADQSSIGEVMPLLMAHLNDERSLQALAPKDEEARKLVSLLTHEDVIET